MHLFVDLFNSSHSILSFLQSFQSFLHSVQSVLSSHSLAVYFVHVFHFVRCVHSFPVLSFPSQCIPLHSIPAQSISHLSIHSVSLSFSPFKSFQSFQSSSRSFNHSFICLFYMCTCIQPLCHPVDQSFSHSMNQSFQSFNHSAMYPFRFTVIPMFFFLPSFLPSFLTSFLPSCIHTQVIICSFIFLFISFFHSCRFHSFTFSPFSSLRNCIFPTCLNLSQGQCRLTPQLVMRMHH